MSTRSRRQTRSRRFNLPPERWPQNHNAAVRAIRLAHTARRHPDVRTIASALTAFSQAAPSVIAAMGKLSATFANVAEALATRRITDRLRTLAEQRTAYLAEKRRDIRRRYNTLDRLATLGYDVRDEMDALATEEAAFNLEAAGITEPEALATATRAAAEFNLTHPKEKR